MIHTDIRCPYKGGENDFSNAIRIAFNMIGFLLYKKKKVFKDYTFFWKYFPDNNCGAEMSKLTEQDKSFIFTHLMINKIIIPDEYSSKLYFNNSSVSI